MVSIGLLNYQEQCSDSAPDKQKSITNSSLQLIIYLRDSFHSFPVYLQNEISRLNTGCRGGGAGKNIEYHHTFSVLDTDLRREFFCQFSELPSVFVLEVTEYCCRVFLL